MRGVHWQHGEARHESELLRGSAQNSAPRRRGRFSEALQERLDKKRELARQLEYPEYDPKFDDPEWMKEQLRKEYNDPRENPNFFLSPEHPEYWHNVARKPYAKAILRSQEHCTMRKGKWREQHAAVECMNTMREEIAAELEECSPEVKRMVTPMMKYKIMDIYLAHLRHEATHKLGMTLAELLETEETRASLAFFREKLDRGGEKAAEALMREFDVRLIDVEGRLKERDKEEQKLADTQPDGSNAKALAEALNLGHKCKKDGALEWGENNHMEALKSWREGAEKLRPLRTSSLPGGDELRELYVATLKNQAQAALKVGCLQEALDAAIAALEIDSQDHKAWFRKACALESLGRLDEVEECLGMVDSIAVGRADRIRIEKDTCAKREKVKALLDRKDARDRRMLQRSLHSGLFSCERERAAELPPANGLPPPPPASRRANAVREADRKRLTRDGAEDLLHALRKAYGDTCFRRQVAKLARDVDFEREAFLAHLPGVALHVQGPVLLRWGFEASPRGVTEMSRAVQDHTRGSKPDLKLRALAEEALKALYGRMYDTIQAPALPDGQLALSSRPEPEDSENESDGSELEDY